MKIMTGRNRVRRGFLVFNLGISFKERQGVSPAVMGLLTQLVYGLVQLAGL
jgi:hypothetical protein